VITKTETQEEWQERLYDTHENAKITWDGKYFFAMCYGVDVGSYCRETSEGAVRAMG
jgi:hypothetical protein